LAVLLATPEGKAMVDEGLKFRRGTASSIRSSRRKLMTIKGR
jgi:hypothetical protein